MKVLLIHNKYQSSYIGGEDIAFENELSSLKDLLGEKNVLSYQLSNDNISIIHLLYSIWFSRKNFRKIKKIIIKNNIDIVHVHNFFPLLTPSAFKAGKSCGVKVVHTLHNYRFWCIAGILYIDGKGICEECVKKRYSFKGIQNKCYRKSYVQSIVAQASFWFYKYANLYKYIDFFFVLTNFQKEKVRSFGIDSKQIILKPNSTISTAKIELNKEGYIFVGRLEESKGIFLLLEIWKELNSKFILTVIGESDVLPDLKNRYQHHSNIIFKGRCSRSQTFGAISKAKYLIQPSLWYETFGLTIIEAFSCGTPVIGLNIGTRKDFIKDGINGFLCERDSLKQTIIKSYFTPKYRMLSENSRKMFNNFENINIAMMQVEIYKKILG